MYTSIIIAIVLIVGIFSYKISGNPDGQVEQVCEIIIKDQTGLDIDISAPEEK
jgi:hypothetical protein